MNLAFGRITASSEVAGAPSKLRLGGRVQARVGKSSGDPTLAAKDAAGAGHQS